MGMEISGKDRAWGLAFAAIMLSYFIWGFQGSRPLIMLAIIPSILLALSFVVPSKYQSHLITSIIFLMAGVLAGVSLEKLFGDIPYIRWAVYTWPVIAVAAGVLRPLPFVERNLPYLKMTAASDAGNKEGRRGLRKYRPHIISILTVGIGGTIISGILYLFGLYGPDIYGSREWLEDFDPVESALIVWGATALCVMLDGPYGAYAKNGREDKEA
jgi:hypothetical protein